MPDQEPKPERFQPFCHFPLPVKVVTRDCHSVMWAWPLLRASAMLLSVCPSILASMIRPLNPKGKSAAAPFELYTQNLSLILVVSFFCLLI